MTLLICLLWLALGISPSSQALTLDDVVVTGDVAQARTIIAGGADVNAKDQDGVTALMRAASAGRGDMVRLLIASGADVNAKTTGGVTAAMMASLGGYVSALEPLLAAKADPNVKDNQGRTALMAAASSSGRQAVDALLKVGANVSMVDAGGSSALTYAAAEGNAGAVDALQKSGAKAGSGEMILAAGRCNTTIVASLLGAGMSVNATEAGAPSPLFVAAGGNCLDTVDLLLARGANVNATNGDGWTPLLKAAAAGNTDVVRRLLAKGADMNVADSLGRTAWMYAAMANREEMAELFRQARAAQRASTPIEVTSATLKANEAMSREYTADGHNVSPPLAWGNLPDGTASIAVICEDPDAGNPPPFVHWVIYNIPPTATGLPENVPFEPNAPMPSTIAGAIQGVSGFRRPIYRGPAPPPGKPHHYHFIVYALDQSGLPPGLTRAELLEAIKDHVLGKGELVAIYGRKP
jgi:Raf kinase inhibitor-like YbhB/YbcL family protein